MQAVTVTFDSRVQTALTDKPSRFVMNTLLQTLDSLMFGSTANDSTNFVSTSIVWVRDRVWGAIMISMTETLRSIMIKADIQFTLMCKLSVSALKVRFVNGPAQQLVDGR